MSIDVFTVFAHDVLTVDVLDFFFLNFFIVVGVKRGEGRTKKVDGTSLSHSMQKRW